MVSDQHRKRQKECATYLRLQIAMDVAQSVQLGDGHEHLTRIEARVLFRDDPCAVQEGTEVASGDIFHGEIDVLRVLEGV